MIRAELRANRTSRPTNEVVRELVDHPKEAGTARARALHMLLWRAWMADPAMATATAILADPVYAVALTSLAQRGVIVHPGRSGRIVLLLKPDGSKIPVEAA